MTGCSGCFRLNKSTVTNLLSVVIIIIGYLSPWQGALIRSAGLFALSGAATNWLAVFMLFEKIPGLYGSGVIPSRFEEFREGIRRLIMTQFFTQENISRLFDKSGNDLQPTSGIQLTTLLDRSDYEMLFGKLLSAVSNGPLGAMLAMVGGPAALEPVKEPFIEKMKEALDEMSQSTKIQTAIRKALQEGSGSQTMLTQVEDIVRKRLDELTPDMVKNIIQDMIREHLGWLVVWGGVFGALLGLIAGLIS